MLKPIVYRLFLAALGVVGCLSSAPAQQLELTLTGSAGEVLTAPNGARLHFSVGETSVRPAPGNDLSLHEGFQQVWLQSVPTEEAAGAIALQAFPNPTADQLQLVTGRLAWAELLDLHGRAVQPRTRVEETATFSLAQLPAGLYLLCGRDERGQLLGALKIQRLR